MILERHYDYPVIEDNKYNDEKFVRECVLSILTTYRKRNLERIVRVSGSVPE
jgi:hypothetical protein